MDSRSVLRSPPAVAGLVLLALVVGVILAMRATMNSGDTTDVAGTVVERSEEPSEPVDVAAAPDDTPSPLIVRPRPDPPEDEPDPVVEPDPPPPAPVEPVEESPVGLIRDPDAPVVIADPAPDPDREPRPNRNRDPQPDPQPEPEPTRRPAPDPEPEPEPEPEPSTRQYELREGDGVSTERAYSEARGSSDNYDWGFVSLASHHDQDGQTANSRKSAARVFVGFSAATKASNESVRDFRCDVLVTAGNRRLITDRDHFFEIQLWTTDGYQQQELVSSVFVREAMDLAPGAERTLRGTTVPDLAAAEGAGYICTAEYRER